MQGLTSVEAVLSLASQVVSQLSAPEPASIALLALMLFVAAALRRRVWLTAASTRPASQRYLSQAASG